MIGCTDSSKLLFNVVKITTIKPKVSKFSIARIRIIQKINYRIEKLEIYTLIFLRKFNGIVAWCQQLFCKRQYGVQKVNLLNGWT